MPSTKIRGFAKPPRLAAPRSNGLSPAELGRWLGDSVATVPSLNDLASVFGLSLDPGSYVRAQPEQLRFTLTVLRDAFPDDGAARRWLRTPAPTGDGQRPIDHLLAGRIDLLEDLAVREWNFSREPPAANREPLSPQHPRREQPCP